MRACLFGCFGALHRHGFPTLDKLSDFVDAIQLSDGLSARAFALVGASRVLKDLEESKDCAGLALIWQNVLRTGALTWITDMGSSLQTPRLARDYYHDLLFFFPGNPGAVANFNRLFGPFRGFEEASTRLKQNKACWVFDCRTKDLTWFEPK
jgi:hypothetical protein